MSTAINRLQYGHDRMREEAETLRETEASIRRIRELRASRFQAQDRGLFGRPDVAEARELAHYTDWDEE